MRRARWASAFRWSSWASQSVTSSPTAQKWLQGELIGAPRQQAVKYAAPTTLACRSPPTRRCRLRHTLLLCCHAGEARGALASAPVGVGTAARGVPTEHEGCQQTVQGCLCCSCTILPAFHQYIIPKGRWQRGQHSTMQRACQPSRCSRRSRPQRQRAGSRPRQQRRHAQPAQVGAGQRLWAALERRRPRPAAPPPPPLRLKRLARAALQAVQHHQRQRHAHHRHAPRVHRQALLQRVPLGRGRGLPQDRRQPGAAVGQVVAGRGGCERRAAPLTRGPHRTAHEGGLRPSSCAPPASSSSSQARLPAPHQAPAALTARAAARRAAGPAAPPRRAPAAPPRTAPRPPPGRPARGRAPRRRTTATAGGRRARVCTATPTSC